MRGVTINNAKLFLIVEKKIFAQKPSDVVFFLRNSKIFIFFYQMYVHITSIF